jgi:hypothetical protein
MPLKNKTKQILLTFDFELFLGSKSGSVDNCLIKPTIELMKVVNKYKLSTVFFVDTLYLYRLKEVSKTNRNAYSDYEKIIDLLKHIIDSGSYIFHHLHPHWLDANYLSENNEWDISNKSRFALNNLPEEEVELVFNYSNIIITEIYSGKTIPPFSGFRAGGLYAQPFSKYKNQMKKHNIRLDFSVLKNSKSNTDLYGFDYSIFPSENIYKFSEDLLVKDDKGNFIECAMNQFKVSGLTKIINGLYYRSNIKKELWKRWGDGNALGNQVKSSAKTNKFSNSETFSIEMLNKYKAQLYVNYIKKEDFLHLISHPKLFSANNLKSFEYFIEKTISKYKIETDLFKILHNHNVI